MTSTTATTPMPTSTENLGLEDEDVFGDKKGVMLRTFHIMSSFSFLLLSHVHLTSASPSPHLTAHLTYASPSPRLTAHLTYASPDPACSCMSMLRIDPHLYRALFNMQLPRLIRIAYAFLIYLYRYSSSIKSRILCRSIPQLVLENTTKLLAHSNST